MNNLSVTSENKNKKILVIGASLAGPAMCYWLKHCGFSPTMIEKHSSLRTGGYAIDLRGIATDVAKKMGLYQQIYDRRTTLESGRYVDALGHTLFEEEGEKFGFRQGDEVEIVRVDLIEILMRAIEDVPCHFSQTVEQFAQHDDYVEVTFKNQRKEKFDLVIAADGLHSSTRRKIFSQDEYTLHNLGSYICVYNIPNYLNLRHSEMLFESDKKLISVTSDKDPMQAQVGMMFRSKHGLKDIRDEAEQKQFLRETYHNFGWETNTLLEMMDNSDNFYFDSITQVKMQSWTKGRIALLGDAGYCPSPLSGQGTSLALVGAYILAGELKAANGNYERAFERYNALLHPFVEANQGFGAWVSETFLMPGDKSKDVAEQRAEVILDKIKSAAHAMTLPEYK